MYTAWQLEGALMYVKKNRCTCTYSTLHAVDACVCIVCGVCVCVCACVRVCVCSVCCVQHGITTM